MIMLGSAGQRSRGERRAGRDLGVARVMFWITVLQGLLFPGGIVSAAEKGFATLEKKLIEEGFAPQRVARIYGSNPPTLQLKMIATMFKLQESRLNYDQFLDAPAMNRAAQFLKAQAVALAQAEKVYGVDRYVIVALLLIETRFGDYTGRTPTLAILSSYALMDQKTYRDRVWALLPAAERARWGRQAFDEKLIKRAAWGYQELCALLRWTQGDPSQLKNLQGSLMGAVGLPQFIPSTLENYAVDGNRDGTIDLFQTADAIMSVGHYLQSLGWTQRSTAADREKIIYQYNHSRPYVQAVLAVADRLRSREG
jgi:membrane-bound lytic murein transglycosylase B